MEEIQNREINQPENQTQEIPVQPQAASAPPIPEDLLPKKKKNILPGALVVFGLIATAFASYTAFQNYQLRKELANKPSPTPTATTDPLASWLTYKNAIKGFQFKYPPGYTYNEIVDLGPNDTRVVFESKNS